jgi:hypothetical protein
MAEIVTSTLDLETVVRVDRGDGTIEEKRSRSTLPMQTCEGATVHALVGPIELFVDDLLPADEMRVPRLFVEQAGEAMRAVVPYVRELEARYRAAMRQLGEQPALSLELSAGTIEALAEALKPTVLVKPPTVNVTNEIVSPEKQIVVKRDPRGLIESATVADV